MFGFVRRYKAAKIAQRDLIAAFENRGKNFLVLPLSVNETLVKEAMMTGIEATMEHFDRMEMFSFGNRDFIVQHYRERAKKFGLVMNFDERTNRLRQELAALHRALSRSRDLKRRAAVLPRTYPIGSTATNPSAGTVSAATPIDSSSPRSYRQKHRMNEAMATMKIRGLRTALAPSICASFSAASSWTNRLVPSSVSKHTP